MAPAAAAGDAKEARGRRQGAPAGLQQGGGAGAEADPSVDTMRGGRSGSHACMPVAPPACANAWCCEQEISAALGWGWSACRHSQRVSIAARAARRRRPVKRARRHGFDRTNRQQAGWHCGACSGSHVQACSLQPSRVKPGRTGDRSTRAAATWRMRPTGRSAACGQPYGRQPPLPPRVSESHAPCGWRCCCCAQPRPAAAPSAGSRPAQTLASRLRLQPRGWRCSRRWRSRVRGGAAVPGECGLRGAAVAARPTTARLAALALFP